MDDYFSMSTQQAALQYISECIRPAGQRDMRVYYGDYHRLRGICHLKTPTLNKLIGILHHKSFKDGKFVADLCAGEGASCRAAKARIDSIYCFLPLMEQYNLSSWHLDAILRGLPHNKVRFVNCSLPVRRSEVEVFIRFISALLNTGERRGLTVDRGVVTLNSPELVDVIIRHQHEIDRVIELYCEQGVPLQRLLRCLEAPIALQEGAL